MEYDRIFYYQEIDLVAIYLKKIFHKNIMRIWIYWAAKKEDKREGILMIIKKATENDLQEILDLQYMAYQSEAKLFNDPDIPPLKQTLPEVYSEYEKGILLKALNEDGKIVGSVRAVCNDDTAYIGKLIVHPDWQRKGIGTRLLLEIEQLCQRERCELFTSTRSTGNIKLYERLGYVSFKETAVNDELRFVYLEKSCR